MKVPYPEGRLPHGEPARVGLRETLSLTLLNTGMVEWEEGQADNPGTAWLQVSQGREEPNLVPLLSAGFGESQTFTWTASDQGRWTLRAYLLGAGAFGEALEVLVEAERRGGIRLRY